MNFANRISDYLEKDVSTNSEIWVPVDNLSSIEMVNFWEKNHSDEKSI